MKNLRILVPSQILVTSKKVRQFLAAETQLGKCNSVIPKIPHKRVILTLIPIANYLSASY